MHAQTVRRAVIDVGTNSVKLLVAEVAGGEVRPLWEESRQTRLGEGFYDTRTLQPGPVGRTAEAVAAFAKKAREQNAASLRVVATSAAREATNTGELRSAIRQTSGLEVEVISGEQEADWVFQGVTSDASLAGEPLLLLDTGGGSTEFILGQGREKRFRGSFPLGTVRLLAKSPPSDPPKAEELATCRVWLRTFLQQQVRPKLGPALAGETKLTLPSKAVQLIGTGGTASILGCMEARLESFDRQRLEATRLSLARLIWHVERLWSLSLEDRKRIIGLPKNRADVILTGTAIYEAVLAEFGFMELRVSTRGLRFGAVLAGGETLATSGR
jgi:exopolyphosphatase/guanosine-5'-triphosphate,3'-diphosphate pyrophosphatase